MSNKEKIIEKMIRKRELETELINLEFKIDRLNEELFEIEEEIDELLSNIIGE